MKQKFVNKILSPVSFLDYVIIENGDGIVLTKDGANVLPGGMVYSIHNRKKSVLDAKKDAVLLFMISRPDDFIGALYYRLSDQQGAYLEYFTLEKVLKSENIPMPEEITPFSDGCLIGFNGKDLSKKLK